jgi:hypothetical protein
MRAAAAGMHAPSAANISTGHDCADIVHTSLMSTPRRTPHYPRLSLVEAAASLCCIRIALPICPGTPPHPLPPPSSRQAVLCQPGELVHTRPPESRKRRRGGWKHKFRERCHIQPQPRRLQSGTESQPRREGPLAFIRQEPSSAAISPVIYLLPDQFSSLSPLPFLPLCCSFPPSCSFQLPLQPFAARYRHWMLVASCRMRWKIQSPNIQSPPSCT